MELIVSSGASRQVVAFDERTKPADVLAVVGASAGELYAADQADALVAGSTLVEQGVGHGAQVIVHTCRQIDAAVSFNTVTKQHSLPPGATLQALKEWAVGPKGFDLPGPERPKHTLMACDGEEELDLTGHLGSYADSGCGACFKLVPAHRFEG